MKTLVLGLQPHLDREAFLQGPYPTFRDARAFFREGVLRSFTPNLATIAVATCLRDLGCDVEFLDLALEFGIPFTQETHRSRDHRLRRHFETHHYDQVFVSCVSSGEHLTLERVARIIRRASPASRIGAGSYHAATTGESLLQAIPELDFVFRGDLEPQAAELMQRLRCGGTRALASLPNAIVRLGDRIVAGARAPARRGSESRFSYAVCSRYLPCYDCLAVLATKGCPYDCAFCQEKAVRRGYATRTPRTVVEEVAENQALYAERCGHGDVPYAFMDPLFGLDKRWLAGFCEALETSGLRFAWGAQTRVGGLSHQEIARLARCGLCVLYYGLESFSPQMLVRMRKTREPRAYLERFEADLDCCARHGVQVEANVLFGHPGETRETLGETRRRIQATQARHPALSLNLNLFRPLPATESLRDAGTDAGSELLIHEWWKQEIVPGTTVSVRPSPDLEPSELLRFYAELYADDRCYGRRGLGAELLRFFAEGEIPVAALAGIAAAIRQQSAKRSRSGTERTPWREAASERPAPPLLPLPS